MLARRDRLDHLIAEQASLGPWAPLIARLRYLRGIETLTAMGLLTEVGDFTAFAHPRRLASFVGLVRLKAPQETVGATDRSPDADQATPGGG